MQRSWGHRGTNRSRFYKALYQKGDFESHGAFWIEEGCDLGQSSWAVFCFPIIPCVFLSPKSWLKWERWVLCRSMAVEPRVRMILGP